MYDITNLSILYHTLSIHRFTKPGGVRSFFKIPSLFLRPRPWQSEIWEYGQISNIFAFRIWVAQFEILRFEIMKTDRKGSPAGPGPRLRGLSILANGVDMMQVTLGKIVYWEFRKKSFKRTTLESMTFHGYRNRAQVHINNNQWLVATGAHEGLQRSARGFDWIYEACDRIQYHV